MHVLIYIAVQHNLPQMIIPAVKVALPPDSDACVAKTLVYSPKSLRSGSSGPDALLHVAWMSSNASFLTRQFLLSTRSSHDRFFASAKILASSAISTSVSATYIALHVIHGADLMFKASQLHSNCW